MLSERQLEALLRIFEQRMQKVVDQYLQDMGEHLKTIGQMLPSDVNRLVELRRVNANVDHIKQEIARAAGLSVQDIEKVFTAVAASDYEFMSKYYGEARQIPIRKNKAILRILQAQARVTSQELANLSQTTILSEGYRRAVDVAVQTAQAGVTDYSSAIRSALREAAKEGLRVRYPNSGLTRRLDTAVRMNVLDGIRALNNDVLEQTGKEFGADGIELSAHALCAEDHLPYQGRQFSMEEFETIQMRLKRPIGMWNCKHTRHPIILGVSEPAHSTEQLERLRRNSSQKITIDGETKTRYEWTQEQRGIETAIRRQNDVVTAAKAAGDNVSRLEAQRNIADLIARYDYVSEKAGLEQRYDRTVGHAVAYKRKSRRKAQSTFNTFDDPIREKIGNAFDSHPSEVEQIIAELKGKGVEIVYRPGAMGYTPGLRRGKRGRFIIDPDASYSAWLHEKTHVEDDESSGWNGMYLMINPQTCAQMEAHAYNIEIDFARKLGYNDIVEQLMNLKQRRLKEILDGYET